jgi:hypothetical protein
MLLVHFCHLPVSLGEKGSGMLYEPYDRLLSIGRERSILLARTLTTCRLTVHTQ